MVVRHVDGGDHHQHDHDQLAADHGGRRRAAASGIAEDGRKRAGRDRGRARGRRVLDPAARARAGPGAGTARARPRPARTAPRSPRTGRRADRARRGSANVPAGPTASGPNTAPTVAPTTTREIARPRSARGVDLGGHEPSELHRGLRHAHEEHAEQEPVQLMAGHRAWPASAAPAAPTPSRASAWAGGPGGRGPPPRPRPRPPRPTW